MLMFNYCKPSIFCLKTSKMKLLFVSVSLFMVFSIQLFDLINFLFSDYLLSNNHVNNILTHPFDFRNEECFAYYVSFLKILSFKLNLNSIHFFFNESTHEFPLFTEALKYYDHPESMARIAVRTLTLNVFKVGFSFSFF